MAYGINWSLFRPVDGQPAAAPAAPAAPRFGAPAAPAAAPAAVDWSQFMVLDPASESEAGYAAKDLLPPGDGTTWAGAVGSSLAGNLPLPRVARDVLLSLPADLASGAGRAIAGVEQSVADALTFGPAPVQPTTEAGPGIGNAFMAGRFGVQPRSRASQVTPETAANAVQPTGVGREIIDQARSAKRFGTSVTRQIEAQESGFGVTGNVLDPSTWGLRDGASLEGVLANAQTVAGEMAPIVVANRFGGAAAGMGTAAAQSYSGNFDEQQRRILEMPAEQLAMVPGFAELRAAGLDEKAARGELARLAGASAGAGAAPFATLSGLILGGPVVDAARVALISRAGSRAAEVAARAGSVAVAPTLEGLQEAGEGMVARFGANQVTGQTGGLGDGSLENFVGGLFGGLASTPGDLRGAVGDPTVPRYQREAMEAEDRIGDQDAAARMVDTADPEVLDIAAGRPRFGLLPGTAPAGTNWNVGPDGVASAPGQGPLRMTAQPTPSRTAPEPPPRDGTDWIAGPEGVARQPGQGPLLGLPAPTEPPILEVTPDGEAAAGPNLRPGPGMVRTSGAAVRPREPIMEVPTRPRPPAPPDDDAPPTAPAPPRAPPAGSGTPGAAPTAASPPVDPEAWLDDPEAQRLASTDIDANPEAFGLPKPVMRRNNVGQWVFPSPQAIKQRIAATPKATKQSVTRGLFDPNYHDALDFLTLMGGLDRTAWMGAEGKRGEGVDKALVRKEGGADQQRFAGIGAPRLFPKEGGMTPHQARELLQEAGFLSREADGSFGQVDDREAVDLVFDALGGKRFYSTDADVQQVRTRIAQARAMQQEFASAQEKRKAEEAEANELGTDRAGLKALIRQMESKAEVEPVETFDDAETAATVAEWGLRAQDAGVPDRDVDDLLLAQGELPRAEVVRRLAALIQEKGRGAQAGNAGQDRAEGARSARGAPAGEGRGADAAGNAGAPGAGAAAGRGAEPESGEAAALRAENERLKAELRTSKLGIPNRRAFDEDAALGWAAVGAADMDGLKKLNDTVGHQQADDVLQVLADELKAASNDRVRFYHLSGDEFAARASDPAELAAILADLQRRLDGRDVAIEVEGEDMVYAGIGLTFGTGSTYDEADQAANRSKRDRLAAGDREEARGNGPPRRLRRAGDPAGNARQGDGVPRQGDGQGAQAGGVPVTPEPAPPAPAPEPTTNPAPAGFSLSAPAAPPASAPAPRFGAQPDLLPPPTSADALRTAQQRTDDRLRFGGAPTERGDLFGGGTSNVQADIAGGDRAALGLEPTPTPPAAPSAPAAPAPTPRRGLAMIQLEVETTEGPMQASADRVLSAQRKRIATIDSLLSCIRS